MEVYEKEIPEIVNQSSWTHIKGGIIEIKLPCAISANCVILNCKKLLNSQGLFNLINAGITTYFNDRNGLA